MWRNFFRITPESPLPRTSLDEEALIEYVYSKIIYQAGVDFESKPMVIICACNLPDPAEVDYDRILSRILNKLDLFVESDYTVVLFAGGARHNPGWTWMFKAYKSLSRKYKKNLKSLYIVQPTTWARFSLDLMNAVISRKFASKIKYINTLSELAIYVPITQIDIPPAVYGYNLKFEDKITLPRLPSYDEDGTLMFGVPIETFMGLEGEKGLPRVVKECVTYLRSEGLFTEGVFRRSPSSLLLKQAMAAYNRGNPVNLEDYGVHIAAVLLKMFFSYLPVAVFPVEVYDTLKFIQTKSGYTKRVEYIRSSVLPLLSPAIIVLLRYVCSLLHEISKHHEKNLMTPYNLAVVFAPNLVHSGKPKLDIQLCLLNPDDPNVGGGVGLLMRLAIEHFDLMFEGYDEQKDKIRDAFTESGTNSMTSSLIIDSLDNTNATTASSSVNFSFDTTNPSLSSISSSSSSSYSPPTPPSSFTTSSSPPKFPSLRKVRSLAVLSKLTSNNDSNDYSDYRNNLYDSIRSVGSGVEISGIKVQGMVSKSQPSTPIVEKCFTKLYS